MANQQYDQLESLIADGMDWDRVTVYALLCENAVFDPAHQHISQAGGWIKREPLQGKFTDEDGNLCGLPAVFYMVVPEVQYQVILGYDDGNHNELLLGFFDEVGGGTHPGGAGRVIVRPAGHS